MIIKVPPHQPTISAFFQSYDSRHMLSCITLLSLRHYQQTKQYKHSVAHTPLLHTALQKHFCFQLGRRASYLRTVAHTRHQDGRITSYEIDTQQLATNCCMSLQAHSHAHLRRSTKACDQQSVVKLMSVQTTIGNVCSGYKYLSRWSARVESGIILERHKDNA
jgi:hypothetical protein